MGFSLVLPGQLSEIQKPTAKKIKYKLNDFLKDLNVGADMTLLLKWNYEMPNQQNPFNTETGTHRLPFWHFVLFFSGGHREPYTYLCEYASCIFVLFMLIINFIFSKA